MDTYDKKLQTELNGGTPLGSADCEGNKRGAVARTFSGDTFECAEGRATRGLSTYRAFKGVVYIVAILAVVLTLVGFSGLAFAQVPVEGLVIGC